LISWDEINCIVHKWVILDLVSNNKSSLENILDFECFFYFFKCFTEWNYDQAVSGYFLNFHWNLFWLRRKFICEANPFLIQWSQLCKFTRLDEVSRIILNKNLSRIMFWYILFNNWRLWQFKICFIFVFEVFFPIWLPWWWLSFELKLKSQNFLVFSFSIANFICYF
jgi:hypothetical protein